MYIFLEKGTVLLACPHGLSSRKLEIYTLVFLLFITKGVVWLLLNSFYYFVSAY